MDWKENWSAKCLWMWEAVIGNRCNFWIWHRWSINRAKRLWSIFYKLQDTFWVSLPLPTKKLKLGLFLFNAPINHSFTYDLKICFSDENEDEVSADDESEERLERRNVKGKVTLVNFKSCMHRYVKKIEHQYELVHINMHHCSSCWLTCCTVAVFK